MEEDIKKTISAVVVTHNRKELLKECLDSILCQVYPVDLIIVIDNASTDGTTEFLKENHYFDNAKIDYIRLPENTGCSGGFYEGIKKAYEKKFDFIWVMDDDAIVREDTLEALINFGNIVKEFGFLSSKAIDAGNLPINVPKIDSRLSSNRYPVWPQFLEYNAVSIRMSTFVSTLINAHIIGQIGFPLKECFMYVDDYEYTNRISGKLKSYIVGNSIVLHKRKIAKPPLIYLEEDKNRIKNHYYKYRNEFFYFRKNGPFKLFKMILQAFYNLYKSLFSKKYPLYKAGIIIRGVFASIFFRPKIEYPQS